MSDISLRGLLRRRDVVSPLLMSQQVVFLSFEIIEDLVLIVVVVLVSVVIRVATTWSILAT